MAGLDQQSVETVFGYFSTEAQAEAAVRDLRAAGFRQNEISIAGRPDSTASGYETSPGVASRTGTEGSAYQEGHKAGEAVGGFWHRIKEMFEGESAEPYADERTRGDLATHEVTSTYDYDPEDFHQSLGGSSAEDSRYFSQRYGQTGEGIVVTVHAGARADEAEDILEANGADLGDEDADVDAGVPAAGAAATGTDSPRRIQLYGEVLRVHRDRVQRGEVRLRKETITETKNIQVPVTREELVLERIPVQGERAVPGATFGEEAEIRIPLSEDRVSIDKQPVVREEVQVGKREVSNVESREESVRREELRVENEDKVRKVS